MRLSRPCTSRRNLRFATLWCWFSIAQAVLATSPAGAEELIVATTLGRTILAEDFSVIRSEGRLYLPLAELGALLLVPVEATGDKRLSAQVTSTGSEVLIDAEAGRITIDGETGDLDRNEFLFVGDRLFLAEEVIERIIPVDIAFNAPAMLLELKASQPLPIEVRKKQEQLRERILNAHEDAVEPTRREFPYALFSMPVGDVNIYSDWSKGGGLRRKYDALVGAELGYLSTQLFMRGDERQSLQDARLKFGRESPDGGVFGFESLTEAWAGDVRQPALPLLGGGAISRGLLASSFPLDRPDSFDATTIDGDAQPGWDVELYQNGLLIAFQKVSEAGRYAFEDVPLLYGVNIFRLVFYGPQGQLHEEERRVTIGGDMVSPGQTMWSLFAGQPNMRLAAPLLAIPEAGEDAAFAFEIEHGVSRNLSVGGYAARARTSAAADREMALSAGIGGRLSWNDLLFSANMAVQDSGGYGFELGGVAAFESFSLSAKYARFQNFRSISASDGLEPLEAVATVRAQRSVPNTPIGPLMVGLRGEHRAYVNGRQQYTAGVDLRHRAGRLHFDHELGLRLTTFADHDAPGSTSILYSPTISLLSGPIWARGAARFSLGSESRLENLAASFRYRFDDVSSMGAEIGYSLMSEAGQLNLSYGRRFDFANVSANAALHDDGEVSVGLGVSFSLGIDRGGRPTFTAERLAERGAVAPFVYYDQDADGRFDPDQDTPLADVGFRLDGSRRPAVRTGADGGAILAELPVSRLLTVDLDDSTVPDPFWISATGPVSLQPRRSRLFDLEIPVVDSGEISGTISVETASGDLTLGGIQVQLSDEEGRVVTEFRTLEDGFYLFERLAPGRYVVRIPAGQEIEDVAILAATVPVTLAPGGDVVDGIDVVLDLDGELDMPSAEENQQFLELFGGPAAGAEAFE
jgi:hypothetical protein